MKRKRSQELAPPAPSKKSAGDVGKNDCVDSTCRLVQLLGQYGLLESLASNLFPHDLYALSLTSKLAYRAIFPTKESRLNLFTKMACDGNGITIRTSCHQKSRFYTEYSCQEYVKCGTNTEERCVQVQPCNVCGRTTCDECRIHCVYQSIYQPPDEPDELPNFSGFALLHSQEMGILSPGHQGVTSSHWADPSLGQQGPHHDQGYLDIPLESDTYAVPESINDIVNQNLGEGELLLSYSSSSPRPSPVIRAFWEATEARKRWFCRQCFYKECRGQGGPHDQCHCTLKRHYLDRWLCLRCYVSEETAIRQHPGAQYAKGVESPVCVCGQRLQDDIETRILCLWCRGEVSASSAPLLVP